jgi:hypothetical protein
MLFVEATLALGHCAASKAIASKFTETDSPRFISVTGTIGSSSVYSFSSSYSRENWEGIAVRANSGIGYNGVASSIPPFDLLTLSVVGEGKVIISIKH